MSNTDMAKQQTSNRTRWKPIESIWVIVNCVEHLPRAASMNGEFEDMVQMRGQRVEQLAALLAIETC